MKESIEKVVLFDGVCNLCNSTVQVLMEWDKDEVLKFASLQSDFGQEVLRKHNLSQNEFDSFIYLRGDKLFQRSDAALNICYDIKNMYQLFYTFILVPKPIRDFVYSYIAKNRYKFFGKRESCMIPEKPVAHRFIE